MKLIKVNIEEIKKMVKKIEEQEKKDKEIIKDKANVTFEYLVDLVLVAKESYIENYKDTLQAFEEKERKIKNEFKDNRALTEYKKAKKARDEELKINRNIAFREFETNAEILRESEIEKVYINTPVMQKIGGFSGLDLTCEEIYVLNKRFTKNGDYWGARMVYELANESELDALYYNSFSDLEWRLYLIDTLEENFKKFLDEYSIKNGAVDHRISVLLDETILESIERQFGFGKTYVEISDKGKAMWLYKKVLELRGIKQVVVLNNILKQCTKEVKQRIFFEMVTDRKIPLKIIALTDFTLEYCKFVLEKYTAEKAQEGEHGINLYFSEKDKRKQEEIKKKMKENPFFEARLEEIEKNTK